MQSFTASLKLWLSMQCQMLGGVSAAMLVQTTFGVSPKIVAKWPNAAANNAALREALAQVLDKKRLHLEPDGDGHFILGQPLVIDGEPWGVLLLHLQLKDKKELPAVLKNLKLGQYWLQFLLQQPDEAPPPAVVPIIDKNSASPALLQLSASLLKENSLQETAISLVNLLAGFLQATRVSLGVRDANNIALEAISFSANFDKRTQAMQAISEAMAEALEQGAAIDFPPAHIAEPAPDSESTLPVLIKHAHQQLQQQQQLQSVHSLLVRNGDVIIGVLTIELDKQAALTNDQRSFVQQALHFAGTIIALRQQAGASVWQGLKQRTAQRLERWFGEDSWRGKIIATLLLILVVALFVPLDYRVSADATLQTTEKYLVVSPQDGYLGKITARPGDSVKKGAALAQLNDEDLRLERQKLASQVQQYRQAYDTALANSDRVDAAIADAQMDQASIQLRLIDQQLGRTQLIAPMDGIIVSDDISQTQGAPVKQGDVLFEIAAAQGFLVQLFVDERDIAAVQSGQEGQVKFSSLPGDVFAVRVKSVTPISEVREGRNYFRVDAELIQELDVLRPGMTGTGKLTAGRRALGWIWFHDLWHWLRLTLW
ncbi:efflux RND transporter periplasmic adaptor subunit [Cellvibrio fibrivorans]|uniref:RND family efflux transporter MFP subunit n=1 Tax=Cellvibrio fibrivorans TaxID=126350 RepID=A0ABU1V0I4_9GAMM|nr:efflux RND transporter periplasmic adaptor subunit [Cellvibrio fibrivorans]MDR7090951.1 RND family efflux transporter MFP subunit [Cellvibrio fibrivorans]